MLHSSSKKSNFVLKYLEKVYDIYKVIFHMIKGRELLLMLSTILAWIFEFILINNFEVGNFINYYNITFFETQNNILQNYIIISIVGFGLIELVNILRKLWRIK